MRPLPALVLLSFVVVAGCKKDEPNPEPPQLSVLSVNPDDGATDVPLDDTIQVVFSHDLDAYTVDLDSVTVTGPDGALAAGRLVPDHRTLLFTPAQFDADTEYTLTVTRDVSSPAGLTLAEPFTSSFTTGQTLSDGSFARPETRPFGDARFVTLTRKVEYVALGMRYRDTDHTLNLIDPLEYDTVEPLPTDDLMHSRPVPGLGEAVQKQGVAGHLDDDIYEEVVAVLQPTVPVGYDVAYPAGHLMIVDEDLVDPELPDRSLAIPGVEPADDGYSHDLALADVDGDGRDEILVTTAHLPSREARLRVFDDQLHDYSLLRDIALLGNLEGSYWSGVRDAAVAVGEVDGDSRPEIVVLTEVERLSGERRVYAMRVFDDVDQQWRDLPAYDVDFEPLPHSDIPEDRLSDDLFELTDLDRDGIDEVVFVSVHMWESPECRFDAHVNVAAFDGRALTDPDVDRQGGVLGAGCPSEPPVHVLEMDGDGVAELFLGGWFTNLDQYVDGAFVAKDEHVDLASSAPWVVHTSTGDVNGDDRQDVILTDTDGSIRAVGLEYVLDHYDLDLNPVYIETWRDGVSAPYLDEHVGTAASDQWGHVVVPANLDDDSTVIERRQHPNPDEPPQPFALSVDHRVVFSDDQIIAVLAAPPCADGIGQNVDECATGLGTSTGTGNTLGAAVTAWAGVSVGFEVETQVGLFASTTAAKFAGKAVASIEAELGASTTVSRQTTVTDFAAHGEDLVIFYSVPQHQYVYTVVSHPDPAYVGSELVVNVPIRAATYSVTRTYYNENNGDQADIGSDIFRHVPGDLSSYPSRARMEEITATHDTFGVFAPPVTVGQGSGSKEIELAITEEFAVDGSITVGVEVEAEACAVGVCGGVVAGLSGSVFAGASYTTETVFVSSVGSIDAEHWAANLYEYGLFAYRGVLDDVYGEPVQSFTVVDYYVE